MNGPQRTACLAKGYTKYCPEYTQSSLIHYIIKPILRVKVVVTYIPLSVRCRTSHSARHGQWAIPSLAGSQNLCQTTSPKFHFRKESNQISNGSNPRLQFQKRLHNNPKTPIFERSQIQISDGVKS